MIRRLTQAPLKLALLLSILSTATSSAGVRHFTYVYEAVTSPPGSVDLENWVTWRTHPPGNPDLDQVDFRHELEFGVTENFQMAVYLADWNYRDGDSTNRGGLSYADSAVELIYNMSNPVIDPLGLSIYQEYKIGDRLFEWESKVIAQKNFGPLILAYNATVEAAWAGTDLREREGEIAQALGASYEISPRFSAGLELVHEIILPEWRTADSATNFFIGPNLSVRHRSAFITITALAQPTRSAAEPDFQMRTIFGIAF
ncbi:MAG TPA: hypothetical protein VIW21_02910 [Chthoniobacterales bacterium]